MHILTSQYCLRNSQDCRACTLRNFKHEAQKDQSPLPQAEMPRGAASAARRPCPGTCGYPSPTLLVRTSFTVKPRSPLPTCARYSSLVNYIASSKVHSPTSVKAREISKAEHTTPIFCLSSFLAWEAQPKTSSVSWTIFPASLHPSVVTLYP